MVLCSEAVQREVILAGAAALHHCTTLPSSPSLFGTRAEDKKSNQKNLSVADLMAVDDSNEDRGPRIAGYFQAVAHSESNLLVLAWCAISMMVLFPKCAAAVATNTSAAWAEYFEGGPTCKPLEARILGLLTGDEKRMALTPMEIVLSEWQLYDRLCK